MEYIKEFRKTYSNSGLEYKKKTFSRIGIVYKILPKKILLFIEKKMKEHDFLVQKDLWEEFKGCERVLDVGCGSGRFLMAAPKGLICLGIEINPHEAIKCKKGGLKVKVGNIENINLKKNSLDGILMSHVIEHLNNPIKILDKLKKSLKKDGKIVIITPNFSVCYKEFYNDPTHKKPFTKQSLFRILYDIGFKEIKIKNYSRHTNLLTSFLVFFPRLRIKIEKILEKFHSPYMIAIARK
ncbi:MAG: class I SAM-dependent methyltransferase [Candidatus Pacearchaeota archaeon]